MCLFFYRPRDSVFPGRGLNMYIAKLCWINFKFRLILVRLKTRAMWEVNKSLVLSILRYQYKSTTQTNTSAVHWCQDSLSLLRLSLPALSTTSHYQLSVPALLPHHFLCSPALLFPLLLPLQPIMVVWQALLAAVIILTIHPISALKGQTPS